MWYVKPNSFSFVSLCHPNKIIQRRKSKWQFVKKDVKYQRGPHAAERSAFSFSAPLNRYITVTTALPPALTKRATDDPAAL